MIMQLLQSLIRKKRKAESRFKYYTGILHLWLGLLSGIVVFIVSLTGGIYTFKNQIIDLYNYDKVYVQEEHKPFLPLDEIRIIFQNQHLEVNQINIPDQKDKSLIIACTDTKTLESGTYYVNPYSGKIIGTGNFGLANFFEIILQLHKTLLLGGIGKQIVGASILIFVILLISGLILWFPKKWKRKQIQDALLIRWKAKFFRINYDLHNVLGFYAFLLLMLIAITGLYVSYPWVKSGLIVALGGTPVLTQDADEETKAELSSKFAEVLQKMVEMESEKADSTPQTSTSIDQIMTNVHQKLNYEGLTKISLPNENNPRFQVQKINQENWLGAHLPDQISFNKKGELKELELFTDKPLHKQFIEISLPLHTGEIMGLPSLIIYFLATLIGCSLPITGFIIWWKKNTPKPKKRKHSK